MHNNFNNLIESFKMIYFVNMKESRSYNNFLILILISVITFIINNTVFYEKFESFIKDFFGNLSFFNPRRKSIILEGKRCLKITNYMTKTDNLFSIRFTAFWYFISKNNLNNSTIYSLKEYANSSNIYDDYGEPKNSNIHKSNNAEKDDLTNDNIMNPDIFVINQSRYFKLTRDIYCKVHTTLDKADEKHKFEMEKINIEIYSYKLSPKMLTIYLDDIYNDYRNQLDMIRNNKKFIYTLIGSSSGSNSHNYDREIKNDWEECEFISMRNFKNLFFEDKKRLIHKIDFFINNREWYEYEGHPYTFGIGLYGPPGTGKTSIIKCIANKLNRHLIVISLNKIKTQREFSEYFFEQYYNKANNKKIEFKDKIIVFEDIDCMTDIVKKRETKEEKESNFEKTNDNSNSNSSEANENPALDKNAIVQNKLLNKIAKKIDNDHIDHVVVDLDKEKHDKITLSFILNIIDGIRETPGRILIITSNNYKSLDPALIRPGRIDMTLEMKNTSVNVIKEMYNHYYNDKIPENIEKDLRDYVVSPAKIVNMRLKNDNKEEFLSDLLQTFSSL